MFCRGCKWPCNSFKEGTETVSESQWILRLVATANKWHFICGQQGLHAQSLWIMHIKFVYDVFLH